MTFEGKKTPILERQERHNEGTLTASIAAKSLVQQDGCENHTHEGKLARTYHITQCRNLFFRVNECELPKRLESRQKI